MGCMDVLLIVAAVPQPEARRRIRLEGSFVCYGKTPVSTISRAYQGVTGGYVAQPSRLECPTRSGSPQSGQKLNNCFDRGRHRETAPRQPSLHLVAALFTVQAPLAEVFTVVGQ